MSTKKYVVTSKPNSGNASVREKGTSNIKTVPREKLPQRTQDDLRRQEKKRR